MSRIIISYDGTDNDRDALALGRALAAGGGELALAYVVHDSADQSEQAHAQELLRRGALELDRPEAEKHVVVNASTPNGLRDLAVRERADLVVFGSEYRTAAGSVVPGTSADQLLEGAPFALAIAPANLRSRADFAIKRIGVLSEAGDTAPGETGQALAAALSATVTEPGEAPIDLLVIGSRNGAPEGELQLSATAEYAIETTAAPVLAVPRSRALSFRAGAAAAATPAG